MMRKRLPFIWLHSYFKITTKMQIHERMLFDFERFIQFWNIYMFFLSAIKLIVHELVISLNRNICIVFI